MLNIKPSRKIKKLSIGFLALFLLVTFVPLLFPAKVSATDYPLFGPTDEGTAYLVVYLKGTTGDQSTYKVHAKRQGTLKGNKTDIDFTYKPHGDYGDSSPLFFGDMDVQSGCTPMSTNKQFYTFDITVTQNGKTAAPAASYQFCNNNNAIGYIYGPLNITVSSTSAPINFGSLSGAFVYYDDSGKQVPFSSDKTRVKLTPLFGDKTATTYKVDSTGAFKTPKDLAPGDYTLQADYDAACDGYVCPVYNIPKLTVHPGGNTYLGVLSSNKAPVATGKPNVEKEPAVKPTCESSMKILGGIICKIIDGIQNAVGYMYDSIIKPLLVTDPVQAKDSSGAPSQIYKAWSNFRIYGDVLLVITLLIIVFGESIGGGVIDAYTAKKVLPRLLVAAILINISFYLVAIMADVANIVGTGVMSLLTAPFGLTGDFTLHIGKTGATTMTALLVGAVVWAKISLAGQGIAWLWFCVLLPLLLIFLAIMVTVLFRRALIVFLIIISPVAFALYCLPNTEKYFKKWWDTLFETLLVFPIIAALFAMGKVGAYLIDQVGGTNFVQGGIADVLAVVALAAPLIFIPFSFKLAGGLIGQVAGLAHDARSKVTLGQASHDRIKAQGARNRLQSRQKLYSGMQDEASKGGRFRRATLGRALKGSSGLLGYNIEADASAARAEVGKTINDQIATGKDDEIRGLTVNKKFAAGQGALVDDGEGNMSNGWMRTNKDGKTQYKSLGGQWVDSADVDKGHSRWGRDTFAQQAALSYEMRKAQSEDQLQDLATNYKEVAQGDGGWGMNDQQAGGAWIGAAFERQNEHLEYKDTDWETGNLKRDANGMLGGGLVDEIYEKKGSYPVAQMGSNTVEQLRTAHSDAQRIIDSSTASREQKAAAIGHQEKIAAIAETFMQQYGGIGGEGAELEERQATIDGQPEQRQTSTPGAAHVAERVRQLAAQTGVYAQAPGPRPAGPTLPDTPYNSQNPQA